MKKIKLIEMLNLKSLLLFITTINLSLMCVHEKSKLVNYSLPFSNLAANAYTVSLDGKTFCCYNDGWLIKMDLSTQTVDSVFVSASTTLHLNVLNSIKGFSIIYFDKRLQYDTTRNKEIMLISFDNNLKLLDSTILEAPKFSYLLCEDFIFSSVFIDKLTDRIYLNDDFSQLITLENKKWIPDWQFHTVIDISNGMIYKIENKKTSSKNEFYLNSKHSIVFLADVSHNPAQFSVLSNKIIYYQDRNLYWKSLNSSADMDFVAHNWFNPCKRFNAGLYHFEKGTLSLIYLN